VKYTSTDRPHWFARRGESGFSVRGLATAGLAAVCLFLSSASLGEGVVQPIEAKSEPSASAPVDWEGRGLSDALVQVTSVGLTFHLPLNSSYTVKPLSERRVESMAKDKSWISAVEIQLTADDTTSVSEVADETIETNRQNSVYATVPKRASLLIDGQKAERLIIKLRPQAGQEEVNAMYTIFKPLPNTFVIYKVWTKVSNADEVFELHRAVVDSFRFTDPKALADRRKTEVGRTVAALAKLNRAAYEKMMKAAQWYRIYTKDEKGQEQEVAYYRITERVGQLGEVNRIADPRTFSSPERDEGVLSSLMSRYLIKSDGSVYVDIESRAWMSFDRKRERWSIRSAQYIKNPSGLGYVVTDRSAVTGDRRENMIQVVVDIPPTPAQTIQVHKPREGYVCQAEQPMLFRILKPWTNATYGMYFLDPKLQKIVYRTEAIEPGILTVSRSKQTKDGKPNLITLNEDGTIAKITMAGGNLLEAIDPQGLLAIWKAKGLPTGRGETGGNAPGSSTKPESSKNRRR